MTVNWITFILGILIMSTISTIGFIIFCDKNEDYMVLLMGPVAWVLILVVWACDKITYYIKYYNMRSLLVCPDGEIRYVNDKLADVLIECEDREYHFPEFSKHPEWNVNDWKKDFVWCGIGNMRYAPKKVWSQYEPISKEEIEYAKEHPYIYKGDGD